MAWESIWKKYCERDQGLVHYLQQQRESLDRRESDKRSVGVQRKRVQKHRPFQQRTLPRTFTVGAEWAAHSFPISAH